MHQSISHAHLASNLKSFHQGLFPHHLHLLHQNLRSSSASDLGGYRRKKLNIHQYRVTIHHQCRVKVQYRNWPMVALTVAQRSLSVVGRISQFKESLVAVAHLCQATYSVHHQFKVRIFCLLQCTLIIQLLREFFLSQMGHHQSADCPPTHRQTVRSFRKMKSSKTFRNLRVK